MTNKRKNDLPLLTRRRAAILFQDESGAATAEYAITTMATIDRTGRISALAPEASPSLSSLPTRDRLGSALLLDLGAPLQFGFVQL